MYLMYQNVLRDSGKSDDMRCFFVVFFGGGWGEFFFLGASGYEECTVETLNSTN